MKIEELVVYVAFGVSPPVTVTVKEVDDTIAKIRKHHDDH